MARYRGKHRKPSNTGRNMTRVAVAGAVLATPIAIAAPANAADWDTLAECESSGDWSANTGNGYHGGLQFDQTTWSAYGGDQYAANAYDANRDQQIEIAEKVLDAQGANAWPGCTAKTDWTSGSTDTSTDTEDDTTNSTAEYQQVEAQSTETSKASTDTAEPQGNYTVQLGDTLGEIGQKFGVDYQSIFEQNSGVLDSPNMIFPGQQLSVN